MLRRRIRAALPWTDPSPPADVDVAGLVAQLSEKLGGRRLHVTVIPMRWSDEDAKRLTRLVDWTLEDRDGVRLVALESCRAAVDQGER
jgi:hypothetical protein